MLVSGKQFLGFAHSPARKEVSWATFHSNQHGRGEVFPFFPSGEVIAIEELLLCRATNLPKRTSGI